MFVAAPDLLGAMHGDRVAVSARRGERGLEGVIVAVLARNLKYVVGPIQHLERGLVIQSLDARLPQEVNVVGNVPGDAVPGLAVVAEIVRFREDGGPPDAGKKPDEQQQPQQQPEQPKNQDERMLDMLERAPSVQRQDAKNRSLSNRPRTEDK